MVDFLPFLKVLPIFFLALVSPGPDFMLVSSLSLSRGRFAGLMSAAGIGTGILVYAAASLWGLGFIFERTVWLMVAVKILGGLYLCYLGILLWRASFQKEERRPQAESMLEKRKNAYVTGLMTSFTNPKAMAFFASVFALALTAETNAPAKAVMAVLCGLTAFGWFGFVALALSTPRLRAQYQRWRRVLDRLAGSILMIFGLKLVFSGKS